MTDYPLSQSRLATYAKCQRKYEFKYDWDVETPEERQRYFDRGNVLHYTIEDVCNRVDTDPDLTDDEIRAYALDRMAHHWRSEMDRSEYYSDAEFTEDRLATRARIEAFFDSGPGFNHVRNSIETEKKVTLERNGEAYHGYVDNIVRTEEGLLLVDYKTSGISIPFTKEYVREHLEDGYRPDRVKPAIQAGLYLEAIETTPLYEPGMDVEFVYYELKKNRSKEVTRLPGEVTVTLEGNARTVADDYRDQKADVWELIERCARGVRGQDFDPEPFDVIYEDTCPDCEYSSICPEYLTEEVSR